MKVTQRREQEAAAKASLREAISSQREAAFWEEYHRRKGANDQKTARLRSLRLAQEAAEPAR
jgi:hypothetical protein